MNDAVKLSKMLWAAREAIAMYADTVEHQTGQRDTWLIRTRDEIDAYRAEQGWNPNGFGGET